MENRVGGRWESIVEIASVCAYLLNYPTVLSVFLVQSTSSSLFFVCLEFDQYP